MKNPLSIISKDHPFVPTRLNADQTQQIVVTTAPCKCRLYLTLHVFSGVIIQNVPLLAGNCRHEGYESREFDSHFSSSLTIRLSLLHYSVSTAW